MRLYKKNSSLNNLIRTSLKKPVGGFTITEVMIVLAVGSTIIAIVFYAVPQLQRVQRDTSRKTLAGRILTSIETYASNNQGTYPFSSDVSGTGFAPSNVWTNCAAQGSSPNIAATCYDWYSTYINNKITLTDPSTGSNINIYYSNALTAPTSGVKSGDIYIGVGDQCSGSFLAPSPNGTGSATSKQFALLVALDRAGIWTCIDNK